MYCTDHTADGLSLRVYDQLDCAMIMLQLINGAQALVSLCLLRACFSR